MKRVATALALLLAVSAVLAQEPETLDPAPVRQLALKNKPWTGDLDKLIERRMIRVLVPYSRTLYYTDKGRERGLTADVVREFEMYLNQKHKTGKRPVTVYLIPTTRDKLLSHVAEGLGDIYVVESNIHGGAKYLDQLMTRYFKDANFSEGNRPLFAFAAYNAGPGNIAKMRREDRRRDHDLRAQHL